MFGPFERAVAGRYLRARRGERFVSVIAIFSLVGIALGVGTLIVVLSVMGGFKADLLDRILGFNGHLSVYATTAPLTDYNAVTDQIRANPGVESATPVVDGQVGFSNGRGTFSGGYVRGITAEDLRQIPSVAGNIRAGSLDTFGGDDAIAVGTGLAQRFGLDVGSNLTLISPQGVSTAIGTIPRQRAYRVAAIFQVGMNEYDTGYVFLPFAAAQTFFNQPGATQIEVRLKDADETQAVRNALVAALRDRPVRVVDWEQSNNSFFAAVQIQRNVLFLILTLIILIAAFNVISSLIMMVKDKTRDIAVLRTIGARQGAIMRIFLMAGAFVGVAGTAVGVVLGVLFCVNIVTIQDWVEAVTGASVFNPEVYYLTHLPSKLQASEVVEVAVIALLLSLLATVYPSWRAARTDPVEALRRE